MGTPTLCPECGAYWPCEHQDLDDTMDEEEASRPRYRGIVKSMFKKNVEAGTLPQAAYDLFFPEDEPNT